MKAHEVLPVVLSMLVILAVAVLEKHSRLFAALTATMPLSAPLAIWVVYAANQGRAEVIQRFNLGLLLGLLPTLAFLVVAYLAARAGWKLLPMLLAGYAAWGVGAALLFAFRKALGL